MADVGVFYRNPEFHDAILLLGSESVHLERSRIAMQAAINSGKRTPLKCNTDSGRPAAVWTYFIAAFISFVTYFMKGLNIAIPATCGFFRSARAASSAEPAADCLNYQIPVHRVILSAGSAYFKTAISTLIGHRAALNVQGTVLPFYPIIVVHEQNVEAALGVLMFLYTNALDSRLSTVSELMQLLLVSWA